MTVPVLYDFHEVKQPGTFVITVEDAYQGYVSRAASTISGGESFLVSLALALVLSDIKVIQEGNTSSKVVEVQGQSRENEKVQKHCN